MDIDRGRTVADGAGDLDETGPGGAGDDRRPRALALSLAVGCGVAVAVLVVVAAVAPAPDRLARGLLVVVAVVLLLGVTTGWIRTVRQLSDFGR